jgi:response regulator RpfG family c-di-GMP phosphodiesterase
MTSDQPYRRALSTSAARAEIERCRGRQFDPAIVDAFLSISDAELMAIRAGAIEPEQGVERPAIAGLALAHQ